MHPHQTNIKEFSTLYLLSVTSPSYKFGSTAVVLVGARRSPNPEMSLSGNQDTLRKVSVGLPEGWHDDRAKRGTVATAVTKYMTETQSAMKKLVRIPALLAQQSSWSSSQIRTSIEGPKGKPDEKQTIAELAGAIMGLGGPHLRATIQHWGHFAIMVWMTPVETCRC